MRRSLNLLEVRTEKFTLISKLIDGSFPEYERLIPQATLPNTATLERDALMQALARLKAVSESGSAVGLVWDAGATELRLPLLRERDVSASETVTGELMAPRASPSRCRSCLSSAKSSTAKCFWSRSTEWAPSVSPRRMMTACWFCKCRCAGRSMRSMLKRHDQKKVTPR